MIAIRCRRYYYPPSSFITKIAKSKKYTCGLIVLSPWLYRTLYSITKLTLITYIYNCFFKVYCWKNLKNISVLNQNEIILYLANQKIIHKKKKINIPIKNIHKRINKLTITGFYPKKKKKKVTNSIYTFTQ